MRRFDLCRSVRNSAFAPSQHKAVPKEVKVLNARFLTAAVAVASAALTLGTVFYLSSGTRAQTTPPVSYGTLDNFDVINDTGHSCHGFEIELEGIGASDVPYTFGAPFQRYGEPTIIPTASGVIVRYAASYDAVSGWSATTPVVAGYFPPTDGHSCWAGVSPDYLNWGCDHFGVSLNKSATKTTYNWLIAGATPGSLVRFGSNVPIPVPNWNVTPPPPEQPLDPPAVETVISPVAPVGNSKFGTPLWIKVWVTTLPNAVGADDLHHMVVDDPNVDIVPSEPAEVEWEWMLLQAKVNNGQILGERKFSGIVPDGTDAVSRRFEFYKYTGQVDTDPDNFGEALCDNPTALDQQLPASPRCGTPDANGVAGVGDLVGVQNAAVNLGGFLEPTASEVSLSGRISTAWGAGLRHAVVALVSTDGEVRTTLTSSLGYYQFDDVKVGQNYVITVSAKRYAFESRALTVDDTLAGVDFVAVPIAGR